MSRAIRDNFIVDTFWSLCREYHSEAVFAGLCDERQRTRLAGGPCARGGEILRLVDHVEATAWARVSFDKGKQRHLEAVDERVTRFLAREAAKVDY